MVIPNGMFDSHLHSTLTDQSIHVWYAALQQPDEVLLNLESSLSKEERERADRFQFSHLRRSFIAGRGILRSILSGYKNCKPAELQFEYTRTGKPLLSDSSGAVDLCFNLSHSGEFVLYAVGQNRKLGIDIEQIRPIEDLTNISARTFSVAENQQLEKVSEGQKLTAFFNCWTRKEAFIKAVGDGISFPLDQFDVSLIPGKPATLLSVYGSVERAAEWSMVELQPVAGYAAALVAEGNDCSVSHYEWTSMSAFVI